MKSHAGTPILASSCEPPENVFSISIPNNELRDYDTARVLDRFDRGGLAGNTQQRAGWEFFGVAPSACVLSLRVVWSHCGHWRGSLQRAIERQVATRRYRPDHWLRPGTVETGRYLSCRCELANTGSD